jgi:hypothetical protein
MSGSAGEKGCSCSAAPVYAASIPSMRACPECGWLEVEIDRTWLSLPGCPKCRRQLALVTGELPISVSHVECNQHFYLDGSGMLYRRSSPFPVDTPPGCARCGTWLARFESLPPRGHCQKCDLQYLFDPLRPVDPCASCGGVIDLAVGVMPARGVCTGCSHEVVLGKSQKPIRGPKARSPRTSRPDSEESNAVTSKIDWDDVIEYAVVGGEIAFGIVVTVAALAVGGFMAWWAFTR